MKDVMDIGTKEDIRHSVKQVTAVPVLEQLGQDRSNEIIDLIFFSGGDDPRIAVDQAIDKIRDRRTQDAAMALAQTALDLYFTLKDRLPNPGLG